MERRHKQHYQKNRSRHNTTIISILEKEDHDFKNSLGYIV